MNPKEAPIQKTDDSDMTQAHGGFLIMQKKFDRARECQGDVFFLQVCDPPTPLRHA